MEKRKTKTIYQVIVVDPVWDNREELGWFTDLKEAAPRLKEVVVQAIETAVTYGAKIVRKDNHKRKMKAEDVEDAVVIPEDFIQEYPGTFGVCIDRSYIPAEDLVEECLPDWELAEEYYGDGESTVCVRGFVQEWPEEIVDALMEWFGPANNFEKFEREE